MFKSSVGVILGFLLQAPLYTPDQQVAVMHLKTEKEEEGEGGKGKEKDHRAD